MINKQCRTADSLISVRNDDIKLARTEASADEDHCKSSINKTRRRSSRATQDRKLLTTRRVRSSASEGVTSNLVSEISAFGKSCCKIGTKSSKDGISAPILDETLLTKCMRSSLLS